MTADLHTLVGAYALDALTTEEHEQFDLHLATCAACRSELAELRATAARLSDATHQSPPAPMKARLLEAIRRTPQDRPLIATQLRRRWSRLAPGLLAAAAALAVVASLGAFFVERGRVADLERQQVVVVEVERQQAAVASVLAAPDVRSHTARSDNGGSVRVLVSASLDQAVVAMRGLPALDDRHSYQMWRIHRGGPESEIVISSDDATGAMTRLVSGVADTDAIAVTIEPAGGSTAPTTKPIVNIALT